jgi:hypothetical protein
MPDQLLAIVVDPGENDSGTLVAAMAEAVQDTEGVTIQRTFSEPYSGAQSDEIQELRDRFDKATVAADVIPKSYVEYRGGLEYEECLTVLGWYGVFHEDAGGVVDEADEAVAVKIAPPGIDPLDPPEEEPES